MKIWPFLLLRIWPFLKFLVAKFGLFNFFRPGNPASVPLASSYSTLSPPCYDMPRVQISYQLECMKTQRLLTFSPFLIPGLPLWSFAELGNPAQLKKLCIIRFANDRIKLCNLTFLERMATFLFVGLMVPLLVSSRTHLSQNAISKQFSWAG